MQIAVLLLGLLVGAAAYIFVAEPIGFLPVLERATPGILYRVRTREPLVALSFDDGPHPRFTPQMLEILAAYGAKATFFLIGERALREPELVARIRAEGHEIGNHYYENGPSLWHSNAEFERELQETESAIGGLKPLRFFRPPGGVAWPWQLSLARARGYKCVLGCAYPHDPMRPPVRYMRWLIEKNLRPGTIVILHDGIKDATRSVAVLPQILEAGKKRGLSFVTIGALMAGGLD
jgi:peptidoglycan/xylan/chitin deacetylase (PgdA/CDA1 family)